jgi:hypothetical protein
MELSIPDERMPKEELKKDYLPMRCNGKKCARRFMVLDKLIGFDV